MWCSTLVFAPALSANCSWFYFLSLVLPRCDPMLYFFLNDNESNWKYWLAVQLSCQHNHLICQEDLLNCQKSYKKNSFSHWWYTLEMFMNQMGHFGDKCWGKILKLFSWDRFVSLCLFVCVALWAHVMNNVGTILSRWVRATFLHGGLTRSIVAEAR